MKMKIKVMMIVLTGCMLMGNARLTPAQETANLAQETADLVEENTVTAESAVQEDAVQEIGITETELPDSGAPDVEIPDETGEEEIAEDEEEPADAEPEEDLEQDSSPAVSYRTHVQSIGWQGWKKDGDMSGTSGQSKRLEGIEIKVSGSTNLGIRYTTHIQSIGWQGWKSDGEMSGTSGQSKRLEAIRIQLTGSDASKYDVWYCVHAQRFGWLNWAKNGEQAGTEGYSYRLEGIMIKILPKGSAAPVRKGTTASPFYSKKNGPEANKNETGVAYNTHVQTYGWQDYAYNGGMAGTKGQSKRLEGIHISLLNPKYSGDIEYRTHIQSIGWQDWKKNGQMSGTSGQARRLEAIQIRLTGEMAEKYDVYYRVHAQRFGWMGWAKNGASAGTAGYSYRLESIQIILVNKGSSAPAGNFGNQIENTGSSFLEYKDPVQEDIKNMLREISGTYEQSAGGNYRGYYKLRIKEDGSIRMSQYYIPMRPTRGENYETVILNGTLTNIRKVKTPNGVNTFSTAYSAQVSGYVRSGYSSSVYIEYSLRVGSVDAGGQKISLW